MNKKTKGIGFGIFLIFVGIIWILAKVDVVDINIWRAFLKLWPVIFIIIGLSLIFDHKPILKSCLWIGFFILIILYGIFGNLGKPKFQENNYEGNIKTYTHSELLNNTKEAELSINSGGAVFNIDSGKEDLISTKIHDKNLVFDIERGKKANIDIYSKYQSKGIDELGENYYWNIDLHEDVLWDIELKTGAVEAELDFSDLKVRNLNLETGASTTEIYFSDKIEKTQVSIKSGVANIEIFVPEDTGIKINFEGALVAKNFTDLNLTKEGDSYYSENYDESPNKINFDMEMATGNIAIKYS